MTARLCFEYLLIELNKAKAPSLLLEDFNYLINKAIYQYINGEYAMYDVNLQNTDNLRVLKGTAYLSKDNNTLFIDDKTGFYYGFLPTDYYHILNCLCLFKYTNDTKCKDNKDSGFINAKRLTSDMWATILTNYYMRPSDKNPYYFLHNGLNENNTYPFLPYKSDNGSSVEYKVTGGLGKGVDLNIVEGDISLSNKLIDKKGNTYSLVDKEGGIRYGNASSVRIEIRSGKSKKYSLDKVFVDYLKAPQHINLTTDLIDYVNDYSLIIEFPDYVCYEILNGLTKLLLENASDPRLQTHLGVNKSIVNVAQAIQPQQ